MNYNCNCSLSLFTYFSQLGIYINFYNEDLFTLLITSAFVIILHMTYESNGDFYQPEVLQENKLFVLRR